MSYAVSVKSHNPGGAVNTLKKNTAWFITAAVILGLSVFAFNKHFGMSKEEREYECNYAYTQKMKDDQNALYWDAQGNKSLSETFAKSARFYEETYNKHCK